MLGSNAPELERSPTTSGVALRASARTFISSAFSFENASMLLSTLIIRTLWSSLATTSKQTPLIVRADETSNPAFASIALVVLMRSFLPMPFKVSDLLYKRVPGSPRMGGRARRGADGRPSGIRRC